MSLYLHPCRTCRLSPTCPVKAEKAELLSKSGITYARFKCDLQKDDLQPGMVVMAEFPIVYENEQSANRFICDLPYFRATLSAVFIGWVDSNKPQKKKPLIFVPTQAAGMLWSFKHNKQLHWLSYSHRKLTPTGETVPVCPRCGIPDSATDEELGDWSCWGGDVMPGDTLGVSTRCAARRLAGGASWPEV